MVQRSNCRCANAKPLDRWTGSPIGVQICEYHGLKIRPRKTSLATKAIAGFKRLITSAWDYQTLDDETEAGESVGPRWYTDAFTGPYTDAR